MSLVVVHKAWSSLHTSGPVLSYCPCLCSGRAKDGPGHWGKSLSQL